jgi:hypothetical protein
LELPDVDDRSPLDPEQYDDTPGAEWAMGDPKAAAELMKKANAISSTGLSRQFQDEFERAAKERQILHPGAPPPTAQQ